MRQISLLLVHTFAFAVALPGLHGGRAIAQSARESVRTEPQSSTIHQRAHAHNDYAHQRPLLDALANGFCSVEADVFLVDGELLVGHDWTELHPSRTLESLYLEPLDALVAANDGNVYPQSADFQLLIDMKTDGAETYTQLSRVLEKYKRFLTEVTDGVVTQRAVSVVVSGNRPIKLISEQTSRLAAIDGRLADLDSVVPDHLMPLISDRWGTHFGWKGKGEMPTAQREKLRQIVERAHADGRKVRFWATPDNVEMWRFLNEADVDYINTDDLQGLAAMLRSEHRNKQE